MNRGTSTRKFLEVAGLNGLQTSLNLVTGMVSARALAPVGRGEFATVAVYATVLGTVLTLGIPQAIVAWKQSLSEVKTFILMFMPAVILLAFSAFAALMLGGTIQSRDPLSLISGTLLAAGGVFAGIATALHQRRHSFAWGFRMIRLAPGVLIILYMSLFWVMTVDDPQLWLLASGLCLCVPSLAFCVSEVRLALFRESDASASEGVSTPRFVHMAFGAGVTILTSQLFFRLDSLLSAARMELEQIGFYAVALSPQAAIVAVTSAATLLAHADLARSNDIGQQRSIVRTSLLRALWVSAILALVVLSVAPWVVPTLYGSDFVDSVQATQILAVAAVPIALDNILIHTWLLLGRTWTLVATQTACLVAGGVILFKVADTNRAEWLAVAALVVLAASCIVKFVAVGLTLVRPPVTPSNDLLKREDLT